MSRKLNIFSGRQFLDINGDPYSGAQLFTYTAGTSTKTTLTQDQAGTSNHANPIILNSKGEPADSGGTAVPMWQADGESVKLVLAPSTDTDPPASAIATWDNLEGVNDTSNSGGGSEWVTGATPTYVSATSFTVPGDLTTTYHVGRRLKTTNSGGTVYSTITAVAYTTLTTVTVENDDGASLDSGLSAVYYSILSSLNNAVPANVNTFKNIITQPDVDGGAADAYTANVAETAYTTNRVYSVQIAATNTGASTLNLDSLGVKNIKLIDGTDPYPGAIVAGMVAKFLYDGTNMVLLNPDPTAVYAGTSGIFPGVWKQLSTATGSGVGSLQLSNVLDSTYDQYLLVLDKVTVSAASAYLQVGTGATPTWQTGAVYDYFYEEYATGAAAWNGAGASATNQIVLGSSSGLYTSGEIRFAQPDATDRYHTFDFRLREMNTLLTHVGVGQYNAVTAITSLRIIPNSGTITGTLVLYGLTK